MLAAHSSHDGAVCTGARAPAHRRTFGLQVEDCQLAIPKSKRCQKKDLDQLFVHINAKGASDKEDADDKFNKARALNRQEFLQCLVRIATMRYVASGAMSDVSDALVTMLRQDFEPRVPMEVHSRGADEPTRTWLAVRCLCTSQCA